MSSSLIAARSGSQARSFGASMTMSSNGASSRTFVWLFACRSGLYRNAIRAIASVMLLALFSGTANAACSDLLAKLQVGQPAYATDVTAYVFNCPAFPGDASFTGNVAIGTASQSRTLHVLGDLQVSGAVTCGSGCGGNGGGGTGQWTTTGSNISFNTGNVGIGTTSPASLLSVGSTNQFTVGSAGQVNGGYFLAPNVALGYHANSLTGIYYELGRSSVDNPDTYLSSPATGYVYVGTAKSGASAYNGTIVAGSVGIGTASPTAGLTITGNQSVGPFYSNLILLPGSTNHYVSVGLESNYLSTVQRWFFGSGSGEGNNNFRIVDLTAGNADRLVIQPSTGNVGIGTTSPSYTLHVNGTAYAAGVAGALSDVRDKKDIAPLSTAALNAILKLRPVTFNWKEPKDDGMRGRQTGLIAQEVEKVLPATVLTAKDARKSKAIKYDELTAILIKAVQEQQAEINELKLANRRLEVRLANVERIRPEKK